MDEAQSFLGSVGNRVGGFFNSIGGTGSNILGSIADKIRNSFQGESYTSLLQPDGTMRQFPIGTRPSPMPSSMVENSRAESIGSQVEPKAEKKESAGTSDKMTIKKQLEDGSKVTINIDMPNKPQGTATPTPTPTVIPEFQNVQPQIQDQIRNAFPEFPNEMINIGARESSLNPEQVNPNNPYVEAFGGTPRDLGLFQINEHWQGPLLKKLGVTPEELLDPEVNIQVARAIIDARIKKGLNPFQPWVAAEGLGLK